MWSEVMLFIIDLPAMIRLVWLFLYHVRLTVKTSFELSSTTLNEQFKSSSSSAVSNGVMMGVVVEGIAFASIEILKASVKFEMFKSDVKFVNAINSYKPGEPEALT